METNTSKESAVEVEGLYHVLKGGTVIHGAELVPDKICAIVSEILAMDPDTGLINLVFRNDGFPSDCMGMAYPDTFSIAVNLRGIFDISLKLAKEEKHLTLRGLLWSNLLSTILHDLHHIQAAYIDREALEDSRKKHGDDVLDETADEYAKEMMVKLARKVDIEPPQMAEMGLFAGLFMELMTSDAVEEEWLGHHLSLMEAGMIYSHDEKEIVIKTYREYLRQTLDSDNEEDAEWSQAVSVIDMVCRLENGSVEVAKAIEPVAAPVIETVQGDIPVEAEAEVAVVAAAGAVVGQDGTEVVVPPVQIAAPEVVLQTGAQTPLFAVDLPAGDDNVVRETVGSPEYVAENAQPGDKTTIVNAAVEAEAAPLQVDQVPLPEVVAKEQQVMSNAANYTAPPAAPPATTYPDNGLTAEVITQALTTIYHRLYHTIFTKCAWQLNNDQAFGAALNVIEPVSISDIIQRFGAENLVMEYDTVNATGQYMSEKFTGHIRGTIMSKAGLPAYDLFLNIGGRRVARRLVPQNPSKMKNGAYTPSAQDARTGHPIMWIIDRDAKKELGQKPFIAKIANNQYEAL